MAVINGETPSKHECTAGVLLSDRLWERCLGCWSQSPTERPVMSEMKAYSEVSILQDKNDTDQREKLLWICQSTSRTAFIASRSFPS